MVINISDVKNGDYDKVTAEIKALKEAVGDKILKVIIVVLHKRRKYE